MPRNARRGRRYSRFRDAPLAPRSFLLVASGNDPVRNVSRLGRRPRHTLRIAWRPSWTPQLLCRVHQPRRCLVAQAQRLISDADRVWALSDVGGRCGRKVNNRTLCKNRKELRHPNSRLGIKGAPPAKGVTDEQITDVVIKWLDDHPESETFLLPTSSWNL